MKKLVSAGLITITASLSTFSQENQAPEPPQAQAPAPEAFASTISTEVQNWPNPDRWSMENIDGIEAARLATTLGYASLALKGEIPQSDSIMLKIQFHSGPNKAPFNAAVGEYGAPGFQITPEKEGWQSAVLGFPTRRARKYLRDGKITIMFGPARNELAVEKIELLPPDQNILLDAYRKFVASGTRSAWENSKNSEFQHFEDYDANADFTASEDESKAGLCIFFRNYILPVFPASVPSEKDRTAKPELKIALDEHEPFQFAARALRDLPECRAEIDGPLPDGLEAETCWLECVPLRTAGGSSSKKWHTQPNRLWTKDIFPTCDVPKDSCQAWWILFRSSKTAKPGTYAIPISIVSKGEKLAGFNLDLTIMPFTLPTIKDYAFGFYSSREVDDNSILADMATHGCNSLSAWPSFAPMNNKKEVDFSSWDDYFARLKQHGLDNSFIWFIGTKDTGGDEISKEFGPEKLNQILKGISVKVAKKAYPANFCVSIDEAVQNKAAFARMKEIFSWTQTNAAAIRRMGVSLDKHENAAAHAGIIDVLSCNGSFQQNSDWCAKNKARMFTYTVFSGRSSAADSRYNCGFNPWRYSASGTFGWALNWYNGNPFNDLDSSISDWGIVLPNWCGKPVSTPAWEAFREGVDDRRYILAYQRLSKDKAPEKTRFLNELKSFLVEEELSTEKFVGDSVFSAKVGDPEKLNQARNKIIDRLLAEPPTQTPPAQQPK